MAKPKKGLRRKLFMCFLAIIAINMIGEAVIYYHNEMIREFADEAQEDIAVEIRISAYLSGVREISSGLFMVASGRKGMGQSAVLQAEIALEELERFFDDVDWEHFVSDKQDFFRCVEIKGQLLNEASKVAELTARRDEESNQMTSQELEHNRAQLELSLARAATLTEHANLYIAKLTDVLEGHTGATAARGRDLIGRVRIAVFLTTLVLAVVALSVAGLFSRWLSRRVVALALVAREFGRGELSRRADARGNDELTALARSFNSMADDLQANIDLQLSKEYVEKIVDTMTNGLIVLDADKRIERIMPAK